MILFFSKFLGNKLNILSLNVRKASKKTSGSTRNPKGHARAKHRGWKVQDRHWVSEGTILATQLKTRFHPGVNVGVGKNCTLYALDCGKVYITCEQLNPNWKHTWVQRNYTARENQSIFKKFFNVMPEKGHVRFKITDEN